jgi:CBS domain-containing protein
MGIIDPDQCGKRRRRDAQEANITILKPWSIRCSSRRTAMTVGEAMTRGVISVAPESLMTKAAQMMLQRIALGIASRKCPRCHAGRRPFNL